MHTYKVISNAYIYGHQLCIHIWASVMHTYRGISNAYIYGHQ